MDGVVNPCNNSSSFERSMLLLLDNLHILQPLRDSKVVAFEHPEKLKERLNLSLGEDGLPDEQLIEVCKEILSASVKTNHPHFHNQLYGALDSYGFVGAILTEACNTNQVTFEITPAFTMIEMALYDSFLRLFGLEEGDCMLCPGGSISNMYGMVLARHKVNPQIKAQGIFGLKPLVVFTCEEGHYSLTKGVNWLGIGTDNLVKIPCDKEGRMIPDLLEKAVLEAIKDGKRPFFVNATSGTTVLGAFDPLDEISEICKKHGLWMHVDACWGGSLIFSKRYSDLLLRGINRADSIAWNPHKMLGAPLQCSIFITRHKGLLLEANSAAAAYLFQKDKFYDTSYDTGDKSVQCGRKVDGFKFWLMWKARGNSGFKELVEQTMECTRYFQKKVATTIGFRLINPDSENINICFWYIPKRLRNMDENEDWWNELSKVAPKIKEKLTIDGSLMISYQPIKNLGLVNFFRLVNTCHPVRTHEDMDYVIQKIDEAGYNL